MGLTSSLYLVIDLTEHDHIHPAIRHEIRRCEALGVLLVRVLRAAVGSTETCWSEESAAAADIIIPL